MSFKAGDGKLGRLGAARSEQNVCLADGKSGRRGGDVPCRSCRSARIVARCANRALTAISATNLGAVGIRAGNPMMFRTEGEL